MNDYLHSAVCVTCILMAGAPGPAALTGGPLPAAPNCPSADFGADRH